MRVTGTLRFVEWLASSGRENPVQQLLQLHDLPLLASTGTSTMSALELASVAAIRCSRVHAALQHRLMMGRSCSLLSDRCVPGRSLQFIGSVRIEVHDKMARDQGPWI
ncbi:hypothetical protein AK812_SmicGene1196 [Symbiodinium microadriaticum]|uniref:Uncharacterized protein n=1 Tax=Symbiodinium microadriaticum TaxID=2951 RepID=A0A1Q9F4N8_SYMMI|nr:hypothetical protein AK812_SmicGene1196 [Symbiodinium microadriaticum]